MFGKFKWQKSRLVYGNIKKQNNVFSARCKFKYVLPRKKRELQLGKWRIFWFWVSSRPQVKRRAGCNRDI